MPPEPSSKRAIAFIDGQNLFYAAKHAFGYNFPNYDVSSLADAVCRASGWTLSRVHFYTGIPSVQDDPFWNHFWSAKLAVMGTRGVVTFSRHLKYRKPDRRAARRHDHHRARRTGERRGRASRARRRSPGP